MARGVLISDRVVYTVWKTYFHMKELLKGSEPKLKEVHLQVNSSLDDEFKLSYQNVVRILNQSYGMENSLERFKKYDDFLRNHLEDVIFSRVPEKEESNIYKVKIRFSGTQEELEKLIQSVEKFNAEVQLISKISKK